MSQNNEEILKKLDKMDNRLDKIDHTLIRQEESLKHHIYRTDLLEAQMGEFKEAIKPIEKHINYMEGALKFIGLFAIIVGIVGGIYKLFL